MSVSNFDAPKEVASNVRQGVASAKRHRFQREHLAGGSATIWSNPNTINVDWEQCAERADLMALEIKSTFWPFSRKMLGFIVTHLHVYPAATLDALLRESGLTLGNGVKTHDCIKQLTELLPVWCVQISGDRSGPGFQGPPEGSKQMGRFPKYIFRVFCNCGARAPAPPLRPPSRARGGEVLERVGTAIAENVRRSIRGPCPSVRGSRGDAEDRSSWGLCCTRPACGMSTPCW